MKTREQLQDEYEDALFALLMYDVAELEGRRAEEENERLRNDPGAQVPEEVDQRCLQVIQKYFFKKKLLQSVKWSGMLLAILTLIGGLIYLWVVGLGLLV